MRGRFWAANAIALGLWEAAAYGTRGRVPTVSSTCRRAQRRCKLGTRVIVAWCFGLVRYLFQA